MHRRSFFCVAALSTGAVALSPGSRSIQADEASAERDNLRGNPPEPLLEAPRANEPNLELGAFSVSLAVKDLDASQKFYEQLGFKPFMGERSKKWLILRNGAHVIGLFQGMFEKNILTFNPGWDQNAKKLESFTDVRELQRQLKSQGMEFVSQADESTTGPASFMVVDPDGNPILVDQHV